MTAREALALGRSGAYRRLDDGRIALAFRAAREDCTLYVRSERGVGYRRVTPEDHVNPETPGWEPGSPKEEEMAKRKADETAREAATVEIPLEGVARTTVTVEGEAAAELAAGLADAMKWERNGRPSLEPYSVRLSDDELRDFGRDLAGVLEDISNLERQQDSIRQEMKAKMAGLEARRDELASVIRRREQLRTIELAWERNYALGQARKLRLDTGDIVQTRPLREDERQPPLLPEVAAAAEGAMAVHAEAAESEAK
jgi:hypothetical protein